MRIDKYLKLSRIIKRRTVASEACDNSHISVNGKTVKPSYNVKIGDIIEVTFGNRVTKVRVLSLGEHQTKESAAEMYEVVS